MAIFCIVDESRQHAAARRPSDGADVDLGWTFPNPLFHIFVISNFVETCAGELAENCHRWSSGPEPTARQDVCKPIFTLKSLYIFIWGQLFPLCSLFCQQHPRISCHWRICDLYMIIFLCLTGTNSLGVVDFYDFFSSLFFFFLLSVLP